MLTQETIDRIEADAAEYARTYAGTKLIKRPYIAGATAEATRFFEREKVLVEALEEIKRRLSGINDYVTVDIISLCDQRLASYKEKEGGK